jgi:ABC-2 type transport system permease protein
MLLYIMNIRKMFVSEVIWFYQNIISVLNLFAVSTLLCVYTGRFIFPMLSLEGRKFWVLGLLPIPRDQLIWGKFTFAATGALVIAVPLILLSDWMLEIPWTGVILHLLAMVMLAVGLSGMAVGLGTCMPNFRETDPSKIAVGFGGTLNLVASLGFLLVVLLLFIGPWHWGMVFAKNAESSLVDWWLVALGVVLGTAFVVACVILPLRAGIRVLRQMEF